MRKRIIDPTPQDALPPADSWLDLEQLAEVEITSEDPACPIESALSLGSSIARSPWRAAEAGPQTIRILFDQPQRLRRIWLRFVEPGARRTQEFVLHWSAGRGQALQEIVRQQWNFNPESAAWQIEDYRVDLPAVGILELHLVPDVAGGNARASLTQMRVA